MKLYTIGFTQKSARQFFDLLAQNGVQRLVDIRVHPDGQLAGFAKKEDLRYFLERLNGCDYVPLPLLAPAEETMKAYREDRDWEKYRAAYLALLDRRGVPGSLDRSLFAEKTCCLLCSEASPEHCHRRLAAERLAEAWGDVEIVHL